MASEQLNEAGVAMPSIGRNVYVDITGAGDWRPAIITRVWGSLTIQLTVFLDVVNDSTLSLRNGLYREGEALAYGSSVQHISEAGEGNLAWTWDHLEVEPEETVPRAAPLDETQS